MAECKVLNILLIRLSLKVRIQVVRWRFIVGPSANVLQFRVDNSFTLVRCVRWRDFVAVLFVIGWCPGIWYDLSVDDFRFWLTVYFTVDVNVLCTVMLLLNLLLKLMILVILMPFAALQTVPTVIIVLWPKRNFLIHAQFPLKIRLFSRTTNITY